MPHKNGPSNSEGSASNGYAAGGGVAASNDAGRRAVDKVLAGIKEAGVQQVELQFADVTGAVKTVAIPARRMAAAVDRR